MDEIIQRFSQARRGLVIAPAGCGKTELVADAVAAPEAGRALVLTHTHAGVHALRKRLQRKRVSPSYYWLDTIAGWALRYAAHFPRTSGIREHRPRESEEWSAVYEGARLLLNLPAIKRGVARSYTCAYIDEYQDCQPEQHSLILALADILPCRIVGDPLQGIFDFGDQQIVDWDADVTQNFEQVGSLRKPWRWEEANPDLGGWTVSLRSALENGAEIDLRDAPVEWCPNTRENQQRSCWTARSQGGTFVGIHKFSGQCHSMAKYMKGFSSDEEMETKDLFKAAKKMDGHSGFALAHEAIVFANSCITRVRTELKTADAAFMRGERATIRSNTKHQAAVKALIALASDKNPPLLHDALQQIRSIRGCRLYRPELWHAMLKTARLFETGEALSIEDAAWRSRERTRRLGKRLPKALFSRTLLVKGMEFDHAVVLDASGMNRKEFYVAATRASRSLTVLSSQPVLRFVTD